MNSNAQTVNATEHSIGLDGYFTLLLSNLVLIVTCGLYWLWLVSVVYRCGKFAPAAAQDCEIITVLGLRPENDQITQEFKTRLNRAAGLFEQGYANTILVIGGKTGNNTQSEAELGVRYLVEQGVSRINLMVEDHSRHTLENLHNAKRLFLSEQNRSAALVTSRYHLARSHRMANSLGMVHRLCAAEDEFIMDFKTAINILKEAYFIHWYEIGKVWAYGVNSQRSFSRIR